MAQPALVAGRGRAWTEIRRAWSFVLSQGREHTHQSCAAAPSVLAVVLSARTSVSPTSRSSSSWYADRRGLCRSSSSSSSCSRGPVSLLWRVPSAGSFSAGRVVLASACVAPRLRSSVPRWFSWRPWCASGFRQFSVLRGARQEEGFVACTF